MEQPGHAHIIVVDQGSCNAVDTSNKVSIPIPTDPREIRIAEFGLAVEQGSIFNFVELKGNVGVKSTILTGTNSVDEVILRIRRRNTTTLFEAEPGTLIFETYRSLISASQQENIAFAFTDGGIGETIPTGYYAYTLAVTRESPLDVVTPPTVVGPIQFSGTSYISNVSSDEHTHLTLF